MVRCILCGKEMETERGLSVHLARTHDVRGPHGRISLKLTEEFFPLLEKKRWTKAKKLLKRIKQNTDEDKWIRGYIHALTGMIAALTGSNSTPQPYIVGIDDFSNKKLKQTKSMFDDLSIKLENKNEFDMAYFQAWKDFTQYLLQTRD